MDGAAANVHECDVVGREDELGSCPVDGGAGEPVDDELKVKIAGVKFTNDAVANTNYTMKGEVGGLFKAKATHTPTGKVVNFNLKWNGKQTADGADAIAPTDLSKITFTLKYVPETTPVKPQKSSKIGKTVKTGDTANILLYMLMMGGAVAGVAGVAGFKRKEEK